MLQALIKKEQLIALLKEKNLNLTKQRGQNFLIDKNMRYKILELIPKEIPLIIEIGSGLGHWTYFLEKISTQLVCIEIDQGFIPILREYFPKVTVIHSDFLTLSLSDMLVRNSPYTSYSIAGNIPYLLSTKILEHILSFPTLPENIFLTVEYDYAIEKLSGSDSLLANKLKYFYNIQLAQKIHRNCFFPVPKKDSMFVKMSLKRIKTPEDLRYMLYLEEIFRQPNQKLQKKLSLYDLTQDFWEKYENIKNLRIHQLQEEDIQSLFQAITNWNKNDFQK